MDINYADMFHQLHPGFFEQAEIRNLPEAYVFDEQVLDLHTFSAEAVTIDCPANITFGWFDGDVSALQEAIREVDDDWVQYFQSEEHVYCAFDEDKVVSFCQLDEFGTFEGLRIGGPGCVGTVPGYRKQGIGLKLVQNATAILQSEGFDLSYIHYTHVGHWYARLGYQTVLRWNARGIKD